MIHADSEKDLGVDITSNFTFNQHCTRMPIKNMDY